MQGSFVADINRAALVSFRIGTIFAAAGWHIFAEVLATATLMFAATGVAEFRQVYAKRRAARSPDWRGWANPALGPER